MKKVAFVLVLLCSVCSWGGEREYLWPKGKMPDAQSGQIAAMTDESQAPGFRPEKHRVPYLEWFEAPNPKIDNDVCMILISGGGYTCTCDMKYIALWKEKLTELGIQCVNFVYRTPRPEGLPIYRTAWEDGQRAVRIVRSQAAKRGFDPEKIGVISMSAGSHLALLLAVNSLTPAYAPIDKTDETPCHINWGILNAPAYVTTDGETSQATREGYGPDVALSNIFQFDEKTCPLSLHHGGADPWSPNGSTMIYRQLRRMGIPAELHLYPGKGHGAYGLERGIEFMRQMGFLGPLEPEVLLMDRFFSDKDRAEVIREDVWPEGKIPSLQEKQGTPYIEWHIPVEKKSDAIQIIYSGGGYRYNNPDDYEVAPARRYLNAMGITVVTLKYRSPRPEGGLSKHTTAWQDLQRAIRIIRSEAASRGLSPDKIGIMGSSAGGHLTLMGVTSAKHRSYKPIDDIDALSCKVQWGIGIYPAYVLSDGFDQHNTTGGNDDNLYIAPEFSFDLDTAPMLMIHGDADYWSAMGSVRVWEKMRAMGIQCELHTLALRSHCFQRTASPGTGSYTWLDRIGEYLQSNCIGKQD